MLRASATTTETEVDITAINGDAAAAAVGVEFGPELMAFAEAVARREPQELEHSRNTLRSNAGTDVLVDAAGVAANFQRMVRIADSMGIPVDDTESDLGKSVRAELDLARFASAQNTFG